MKKSNKLLSGGGKERSSNLELYRIVCMLMIVAHHYVVLSGLMGTDGPMRAEPLAANSLYLYLFGMWGKTGINCFLMITGYFMCYSSISIRKFLKLYLWVVFYRAALVLFFAVIGYQPLSIKDIQVFFPFRTIHSDSFTSSFLVWWLFIPFLNVLANNMTKRQHQLLIALSVIVFTGYSFVPKLLSIEVNPICWFSTIYMIASYIRKYPETIYKSDSVKFWGITSMVLITLSMVSVIAILVLGNYMGRQLPQYWMVSDSQQPLALLVAVSTFMWFKNMMLPQNRLVNTLGGASFGVLLIHSGSATMMRWLWKDTVDCVGHYSLSFLQLVGYSFGAVLAIYLVCSIVDYLRLKYLERPFFIWYDSKPRFVKLQSFLN